MSRFIDRRLNSKNKSMINRQRFIRRFKKQIKQAVSKAISGRSITNIEQGEKVNIPTKDLNEPSFHQGQGGIYEKFFQAMKTFLLVIRLKDHHPSQVDKERAVKQAIKVKVKITLFLKYPEKNF